MLEFAIRTKGEPAEALIPTKSAAASCSTPRAVSSIETRCSIRPAPQTRREQLAKFPTEDEQFPKAYVNRIWGHLFGRGLNEQPTVDDFGDHNKIVHPELLDYLEAEFAAESSAYEFNRYNAFDPQKLLYWLCTSEAYSLSSVANATNDKPEADLFFSRMLLKAMSPEQLFESLSTATEGHTQSYSKEKRDRRDAWMKHSSSISVTMKAMRSRSTERFCKP